MSQNFNLLCPQNHKMYLQKRTCATNLELYNKQRNIHSSGQLWLWLNQGGRLYISLGGSACYVKERSQEEQTPRSLRVYKTTSTSNNFKNRTCVEFPLHCRDYIVPLSTYYNVMVTFPVLKFLWRSMSLPRSILRSSWADRSLKISVLNL